MTLISRRGMMVLSLAGTVLVAACSSPNPRLFTLAPVPGVAKGGGPRVVLLHQIVVARYLERPEIVRSSDNYRLDVMAIDAWGEPIGAMLGRVLAENLSQRLPGTTVIGSDSAVAAKEDASVGVNIQRMDIDASLALVLSAQASVTFTDSRRASEMRSLNTKVPVSAATVGEEVRGGSIALGRLADEIAAMLREPVHHPPPARPSHPARQRR
jgi:uncharacterized lipoprotein YmbA